MDTPFPVRYPVKWTPPATVASNLQNLYPKRLPTRWWLKAMFIVWTEPMVGPFQGKAER